MTVLILNIMIAYASCGHLRSDAPCFILRVLIRASFTSLANSFNSEVMIVVTDVSGTEANIQVLVLHDLVIGALCAAALGVHSESILGIASAFDAGGRVVWAPLKVIGTNVIIAVASGVFGYIVKTSTAAATILH